MAATGLGGAGHDGTGPDGTGLVGAGPYGTGPDGTWSDGTGPGAGPDGTGPDGTGSDGAAPVVGPADGPAAGTGQGEAVLAAAVAAYRAALGSRLVAAYALGSLAHGGFSPLVSDVDLALILQDPLKVSDRLAIHRVAATVRAGGSALHERLSVFWGTPSATPGQVRSGRFPPLDRLDLIEHGRLLTGRDIRPALARPGPDDLLVGGAEFALGYLGGVHRLPARLRGWARRGSPDINVPDDIRSPALLVSGGPRTLTKTVLFPVRFLFTAATGQAAPVTRAAEHYLADRSVPAAELVTAALAWRYEPPADDQAATALLSRDLIPLYLHFIDDHIARLQGAGHHQLAASFRQWRTRLLV
jgi:hypothetical protein